MDYNEIKGLILNHMVSEGFTMKGKDSVYKLVNGSFVLVKPRKHTMSPTRFFVDYGIVYQFEGNKKPSKISDCHLSGEFSNIANKMTNDFKAWDTESSDNDFFIEMIDKFALPYLEKISSIEYIAANYPDNFDSHMGIPTSGANHTYLCSF